MSDTDREADENSLFTGEMLSGILNHQEQLKRYRFRHQPLTYLETLEARWEQASCT